MKSPRFSQPQDRFLLGKKFDKSHNGTCEAKALAAVHHVPPCVGVERERMRDSKPFRLNFFLFTAHFIKF
jgi:hypothetical protein